MNDKMEIKQNKKTGTKEKVLLIYCIIICGLLGVTGMLYSRVNWLRRMNPDALEAIPVFEQRIEETKSNIAELEEQIEELGGR